MAYRAPVADILFSLKHAAGFAQAQRDGLYDLGDDDLEAILEAAGRFAGEAIAPLHAIGDRFGTPFDDGRVTMPPGWKEAYRAWAAAGWNGLAAPSKWGGQGLPRAVNAACTEMWNAASMAFAVAPLLTMSAIDALAAHGSADLKKTYLPKLVSGEWMGTMQLTEPQAGSDVGALRTKAERAGDGSYRIVGTKIFITYGEHDLTDNIIHFVLARLAGAPEGTRGLSLFLVPKFMVGPDGTLGKRNGGGRQHDPRVDPVLWALDTLRRNHAGMFGPPIAWRDSAYIGRCLCWIDQRVGDWLGPLRRSHSCYGRRHDRLRDRSFDRASLAHALRRIHQAR
jgi:acyl-CoA dehydrogenase